MKILKFGGTSVGSPSSLRAVLTIVENQLKAKEAFIVVVSAFSGVTNKLLEAGLTAVETQGDYSTIFSEIATRHIEMAKTLLTAQNQSRTLARVKKLLNEVEDVLQGISLIRELTPRTHDLLASYGERLSALIISDYLSQEGIEAQMADARAFIRTDSHFGKAQVLITPTFERIKAYFSNINVVPVVTGFIASTEKDEVSTLGRGGSDYTAALLGAALDASLIEIWTDVNGMLTSDPRMVKSAFTLPQVSYQEALELSHFGAKVIYPPTLQPAFSKNIPIRIANTFEPEHFGTLISRQTGEWEYAIKGISSISEVALINVQGSGLVGVTGFAGRLFSALAKSGVNVIMISQASSEHSICVALEPNQGIQALESLSKEFEREIELGQMDKPELETGVSVVAIIGENMRKTSGVSARIFQALGNNGISVVASAQGSSELNISVVIKQKDLSKAVNALHQVFFLKDTRYLIVYLIGPGLIGKTLLNQIAEQENFLLESKRLAIRLTGICNSQKMILDAEGIPLNNYQNSLFDKGEPTHIETFIKRIKQLNLPNSVVIDTTAGNIAVPFYEKLLSANVSIVTPNKLANSGPLERYKKLQQTTLNHGSKFLYETNAGAGLPIINTLKDLINSGDEVIKIEGVLSGTLSYIFSTFSNTIPFHQAVKQAQDLGYTEPDPRDDLNGADMARKILILAREAGLELEAADIEIEPILPKSCSEALSVDAFYKCLYKELAYFEALRVKAEKEGGILRYVGVITKESASIKLIVATPESPFYAMRGSDNMVAFTTKRYKNTPMVIKGPGAGAEVTAASVFAELISLGKL